MKKILFICVGNSGRSQMAEAFFNHMVQGKAIAISAGTSPAMQMSPVVIKAMEEIGISMEGHTPKLLTPDMFQDADLAITMGCGVEGVCPASFIQTDDWNLEDPKGKPIEEVQREYGLKDVINIETTIKSDRVAQILETFSEKNMVLETDVGYRVYCEDVEKATPDIVRSLDTIGCKVTKIETQQPSLEDVFFRLTERVVREVS